MGLRSIFNNIRKRGLKDVTNPDRIGMYLRGEEISKKGITLEADEIIPYAEQLIWRIYHAQCGQCFRDGECKICSCSFPSAALTETFHCEGGGYGEMFTEETEYTYIDDKGNKVKDVFDKISAEKWNQHKKDKGIIFSVKQNIN